MSSITLLDQSTFMPLPPVREISSGDNGMLMTPEEYDEHEEWDEEFNYELINGVLIVSPAPGPSELVPNDFLGHMLRNYADQHPGVIDLTYFEVTIRLPNGRRRADRALWVGLGRSPNPYRDVPSIAIEYVSRDRRDRIRDYVTKRAEYLDLGIREYWVIDRFQCILTVFQRANGIDTHQVIPANESYRTPLLPGFELPLQKLFNLANKDYGQDSSEN